MTTTKRNSYVASGVLLVLVSTICATGGVAVAQTSHLMVPQSIRYEHAAIIDRLTKEAAKEGIAAAVAQRALIAIKAHFAKEEEFVFPPLGLLDQISAREMPTEQVKRAAIDMAERTKAAEGTLNEEHAQINSLMNELMQTATRASEPDLMKFASDVAAHSLNEIEILQPTTIMIGDYLRAKP